MKPDKFALPLFLAGCGFVCAAAFALHVSAGLFAVGAVFVVLGLASRK